MVKRHLSGWITTEPLLEAILETMEEQKANVSYSEAINNARKLWLDFLKTELHSGISNSLTALVDKGEIKVEPLPF
jgi:hypothetical protein